MLNPHKIVAREQGALAVHRASLRGGDLPAPQSAPRGTFVHGLLLPLSLLAATLRSPVLRAPFLRLAAVRGALLAVFAVLALAVGNAEEEASPGPSVAASHDRDQDDDDSPVDVDVRGLHVHIDQAKNQGSVVILGHRVPIAELAAPVAPPPPTSRLARLRDGLARRWKRIVAFVGGLSVLEGVIVFFTRRWDDWLSFHVSALAGIRPESPRPPERAVSFDVKWIRRKVTRRLRGYVILASGMPLLYLLRLVPVVGSWLFGVIATLWAWYWVGVFTASKSAHAWADDGIAPPPQVVRSFNARFATGWWWWPLRVYGRLWAWLVRGVSSAAATFDRSPAPFLGLALARAVLALPGLYLLARPIVPVAAGRLCAESDPADRFVVGTPGQAPAPGAVT